MGPGLSGTSWKTSLCSCQVPFSSSLGAEGGCVCYHIERMRRQVNEWECHSITHSVLIFENHRLRVILVGTIDTILQTIERHNHRHGQWTLTLYVI